MRTRIACALACLMLAAEAGPTTAIVAPDGRFVPPASDALVIAQVERAKLTLQLAGLAARRATLAAPIR
ncbi:MAG: hypothetical protein EOP59_18350 [Sphingomonadales bacterium]|nr:MAG: hypothetical protein EOP59_18350 [Sphingomonadales bacterium]